ncbi:MAG: Rne/Rng family ribonuclease [Phycisphaerae bacterium]|nr:Rne/Rng family ribonuclease [Phycisphaerae bacterium]NUQ49726.1 Rne/Rng family ribonuclease [Phycisphaerae bacterium]
MTAESLALSLEEEGQEAAAATPAPAGNKEMIINVVPREECRIAVLEDGKLEEIYLERASAENHVGNIYKGVVTNVEPSIQAAFIDFGLGKNGFLHISDLHPQYFPGGDKQVENVGRKLPRRARPPVQRCLRRGQEILVQITKEGIGTKGPTLTTYLSIPGRFLVMMPGMRRLGVSRKIEDDDIRDTLRSAMFELDLPEDMGFIARTAAQGRTKRELQMDLNYLSRLWRAVETRIRNERAPAELYRESDLVIRTIRDVFTSDVHQIIVDDPEVAERAREFLSIFSPRSRDMVIEYNAPEPIFHRYGIEAELERLHSRHVPLRSGGSLVIDQTEALVAIDVNSGRFRTEDDAEATAYKINIEAADEIPRQLRLRDLGGVIICDFIDMRHESHRRDIEKRLIRNLKHHKERAKVLRMSAFGIIEMTRQRQRASLTRSVYQDCHHCRGTGLVKTTESVALDVIRLLQLSVTREQIASIEVTVSPEVAFLLQNRKRALIHAFETRNHRTIAIRPEPRFGLDQVQIQCSDARGRLVPHP